MTLQIDMEYDMDLGFDYKETAQKVMKAALEFEKCPYEAEINLVLTDNAGIQSVNREFRGIDQPTDVLSFPLLSYSEAASFEGLEESPEACFNLDTGELMLGDIMISLEKVAEQARLYNHSLLREFSFLFAHSMLHLMGYDHLIPDEAEVMEQRQEAILNGLNILR